MGQVPMPVSSGIDALREKLHAQMSESQAHSCVEEAEKLAAKMIYWRRDRDREPQCMKEEGRRERETGNRDKGNVVLGRRRYL
jgi:hypothetical protein